MPVDTWYLTQNPGSEAKKLGHLDGWRKEVAQLLLGKESDTDTKAEIAKLVADEKKSENSKLIFQVIELLPKNSRGRARILAQHLMHQIKIDESGRVIYPDGTIGSAFIDILKYFCTPKSNFGTKKAPFDVEKMTAFLRETNVPESATIFDVRALKPTTKWISV